MDTPGLAAGPVLVKVSFFLFLSFFLSSIADLQFLLISAVQHSDSGIHIYAFFCTFFSIMFYHRISNRAPCALQEDLVVCPFCI